MAYERISEVQRKDGTKIVYEYDSESLQLRATRTATESMPEGIKEGYILGQAVEKNVLAEDIGAYCRINKKLGLEVKAAWNEKLNTE